MNKPTESDTKARILQAAEQLFSQDGFDATGVQALAKAAGVNKAMLYYYFDSKDAILDVLIDGFFQDITALSMGLVRSVIVSMIHEGRLDIQADRFHFHTAEDVQTFQRHIIDYNQDMLTFMLSKRALLRILLMESLKRGRHKGSLFGFFRLLERDERNPLYQAIVHADPDLHYSDTIVLQKFFFSLIPLIAFAVFYDGFKEFSGLDDATMQSAYLQALFSLYTGFFVGNDLIVPMEAADAGFAQWQALAAQRPPQ